MNSSSKLITYLKIITIFWFVMSLYGIFVRTFDPTGYMEGQVAMRYLGEQKIPNDVRGPFEFVMFLYSLTSLTALIMQYAILHYVFPRREKWGFWTLTGSWALWLATATIFQASFGNYFYIKFAVLPIAAMLLLPLALTWPHFSKK